MDADKIKSTVDILQLASQDTTLKKVSTSGGGEWAGPCPMCGGEDRFRVQPYREDGGKWYCRGCGNEHWHDAIDYVMARDRIDFMEALEKLGEAKFIPPQKEEEVAEPTLDRAKWDDAARRFTDHCIEQLWNGSDSTKALDYLHKRGLLDGTLLAWRIGYHPEEGRGDSTAWGFEKAVNVSLPRGIVIPCFNELGLHYVKVRRGSGANKYHNVKGSRGFLFGAQTFKSAAIAFLFESELDALLAWQTGFVLGYGSLPAGQPLKSEYSPFFLGIEDLIVAYDNDDRGQKAANKMCKLSSHFHKARPYPAGKDLTEYYQSTGNRDSVFYYLYSQLELIGAKHGT